MHSVPIFLLLTTLFPVNTHARSDHFGFNHLCHYTAADGLRNDKHSGVKAFPISGPVETTTCLDTLPEACPFSDSLKAKPLLATCNSTCTGSLGANIFPDGDFGSGVPNIVQVNPNLAPGYIYQLNPPPDDGYYCITNNTTPWGSFGASAWIDI